MGNPDFFFFSPRCGRNRDAVGTSSDASSGIPPKGREGLGQGWGSEVARKERGGALLPEEEKREKV